MEEADGGHGPGEERGAGTDPPDGTLGGYLTTHDRPPAFEGADGLPYTVSVEIEESSEPAAPFTGYLIFPRWAETGLGVVGHLETPTLLEGRTREEVEKGLTALTLAEVRGFLDEAIEKRNHEDD